MKPLPIIAASALVLVLLAAPVFAQTTYKITVTTDSASYSGTQAVHVSGSVSPSPGASQAASFTVTNPGGTTYPLAGTANIDPTTGDFTFVFNTGGTYYTASGTYTLTAEYAGDYGSTTFTYSPSVTPTGGISTTQYKDLMGNMTILQQEVATLQKDLAGNSSSLSSAIASLSSSVSSISSSLTTLQSSVTSISNAVGQLSSSLGTVSSQVTTAATNAQNAANSVATTQTYVLVVAVLVAITLVLELAILVRKVS